MAGASVRFKFDAQDEFIGGDENGKEDEEGELSGIRFPDLRFVFPRFSLNDCDGLARCNSGRFLHSTSAMPSTRNNATLEEATRKLEAILKSTPADAPTRDSDEEPS